MSYPLFNPHLPSNHWIPCILSCIIFDIIMKCDIMMAPRHWHALRITGPLCGESTDHRRIPITETQLWRRWHIISLHVVSCLVMPRHVMSCHMTISPIIFFTVKLMTTNYLYRCYLKPCFPDDKWQWLVFVTKSMTLKLLISIEIPPTVTTCPKIYAGNMLT